MTIKSVVDIDLNDEKFKRFVDHYNRYQDALKNQPQQWKDAEQAVGGVDETVNKILAAFLAMGSFQQQLRDENDKDNKELKHKLTIWEKIQKASLGTMHNVEDTAKWFLKWGSVGVGLSLAGLFGLRAIAQDVAEQRNTALGLDTGIGSPEAFARHQGRYFDNPTQLLQGAFTAKSNLASPAYQAIASLGINPNQSTVDISNALLLKLQQMANGLPQQQVGNLLQEFPGLSQFGIGLEDLEKLRRIKPEELQGQIAAYQSDVRNASLSDSQGLAFQNFVSGIDTTFARLTKDIERDLVPLLGPIEHLVSVIGRDISSLLRGGVAAKALDELSGAIDRFASYLGQGKFNKDVDDFANGIETFTNVVGFSAHLLRHPLDTMGEGAGDVWQGFKDWEAGVEARAHGGNANWRNAPTSPVRATAHVQVTVRNATGADLHTAVNALNGGVGP